MHVVDLGAEIRDGQVSHFPVTLREHSSYRENAVYTRPPANGFSTRLIQMCDHTATHVDAPVHFFPNAASIDSLPVSAFCGSAVCLDLFPPRDAQRAAAVAHFEEALSRAGLTVDAGDIVLLRLGAGGYAGISAALADALALRRISSLGVDAPTPDCPDDPTMPVHLRLLGAGITLVEGLRNLELVAGKRFLYVGAPLKLVGATGSPLRPLAILD